LLLPKDIICVSDDTFVTVKAMDTVRFFRAQMQD
jgi:hypothetical protein